MNNKLVETIIEAIREKKGFDITVIDISKQSSFADYFVICTGVSGVQTGAIAENVVRKARKVQKAKGIEGESAGLWILIDFADVIVHIFQSDIREKFALENLWADGVITRIEEENIDS